MSMSLTGAHEPLCFVTERWCAMQEVLMVQTHIVVSRYSQNTREGARLSWWKRCVNSQRNNGELSAWSCMSINSVAFRAQLTLFEH